MLSLIAGCLGDLNGVLACLKGYLNACHVRTDQLIVVTGRECLGVVSPTVGSLEFVAALLAFVYEELSATDLGILQTDVYCHLIYAGLFYGYGVKEGLIFALGDVVVLVGQRIGIRAGACIYFIVCGVLVGLVFPTGNKYYAFFGESLRESCGELVYFVVAVAVNVEDGCYVLSFEGVIAVCALAINNLVLVLGIYVTAIGTNAPRIVLSLRIVNVVVQIAVNVGSHRNCFLSKNDLAAVSTLNAGGETVCITGGSYCRDFFGGVLGSGDFNFLGFLAVGALNGANACCGAGCGSNNGYFLAPGMLTVCGDFFGLGAFTNRAGVSSNTGSCAVSGGGYFACVPIVGNYRDVSLSNSNGAAFGALLTCGQTCFGTGRSLGRK